MANDTPEAIVATQTGSPGGQVTGAGPPLPQAPTTGRQAFRGLRRQLTDEELANPGVQKILLDDLERVETECAELMKVEERYHQAEKRAAILEERLKSDRAIEIFFGVGTALGGAIIGLAPYFWELFKPNHVPGYIAFGIGILIMAGATVGRMVKR